MAKKVFIRGTTCYSAALSAWYGWGFVYDYQFSILLENIGITGFHASIRNIFFLLLILISSYIGTHLAKYIYEKKCQLSKVFDLCLILSGTVSLILVFLSFNYHDAYFIPLLNVSIILTHFLPIIALYYFTTRKIKLGIQAIAFTITNITILHLLLKSLMVWH